MSSQESDYNDSQEPFLPYGPIGPEPQFMSSSFNVPNTDENSQDAAEKYTETEVHVSLISRGNILVVNSLRRSELKRSDTNTRKTLNYAKIFSIRLNLR